MKKSKIPKIINTEVLEAIERLSLAPYAEDGVDAMLVLNYIAFLEHEARVMD